MNNSKENKFIGYERRRVSVNEDTENMYVDAYKCFGWELDASYPRHEYLKNDTIQFKRDRKIENKTGLTALQHQFEIVASEIEKKEKSKSSSATIIAVVIGIIGTVCMAGGTFAFLGGMIVPCILLAVPGFLGWILPYFLHKSTYTKKSKILNPLIDEEYDEIYEICEKANTLIRQVAS